MAQPYGFQQIGKIQQNYKADLQIINLDTPHSTPVYDPVATLVYSAEEGDSESVMVNGQWIMKDRNVLHLDEALILKECKKLGTKIYSFLVESNDSQQ